MKGPRLSMAVLINTTHPEGPRPSMCRSHAQTFVRGCRTYMSGTYPIFLTSTSPALSDLAEPVDRTRLHTSVSELQDLRRSLGFKPVLISRHRVPTTLTIQTLILTLIQNLVLKAGLLSLSFYSMPQNTRATSKLGRVVVSLGAPSLNLSPLGGQ